ncbi:DDE-type integrase/transposase/recombinase [Cardinium endosymbiont of Oedothorax gibbosus]|uniref:DDE-type integrase/transposase/recombinase n=1 Tax=Cardinium endosymbiont of Oedothorax gibbosus TaxID=931101 RepID=UPI003F6C6095
MLKKNRKKSVSTSWRLDETYVKLKGKWVYLYRAIDSADNTIDFLFREHRNKEAALEFFRKTLGAHKLIDKLVNGKKKK